MSSLLTFRCRGIRYAIEANLVLEVVEMPALSGWPSAPLGVAGVLDYQGELVPVVEVAVRVGGREPSAIRDCDQLILAQVGSSKLALWVDEALELVSDQQLHDLPQELPAPLRAARPFLSGFLSGEEQVVVKLDLDALADFPEEKSPQVASWELSCVEENSSVLMERARELARPNSSSETSQLRHLVVLALEGERFGLPVEEVAELAHCPSLTRVPGTPPHLLGLAYHRGELLRVVDIRALCGLNAEGPVPEQLVVLSGPGMPTGVVFYRIEAVLGFEETGDKIAFEGGWLTVLDLQRLDLREPPERNWVGHDADLETGVHL